MIKGCLVGALTAGLVAGAVPAATAQQADVAAPNQSAYELTIELMDRAAVADVVARSRGGWSLQMNFRAQAGAPQRWTCCPAAQRATALAGSKRDDAQVSPFVAVDLRHGRYRLSLDGRSWLAGSPTRTLARLERTRAVAAALRVAGRPKAGWLAASAQQPIPLLAPGSLYADMAAGTLPSIAAQAIGMPTNVLRLRRRTSPAGLTYYWGEMRRYGQVTSFEFTFQGQELTTSTISEQGLVQSLRWRYQRPTVRFPDSRVIIGARALRAAIGYSRFRARSRAIAAQVRRDVARKTNGDPRPSDQAMAAFVRQRLARRATWLGPVGIVIGYRVGPLAHGGRLAVHTRYGHASRSVTWDAARLRVRVSRVG